MSKAATVEIGSVTAKVETNDETDVESKPSYLSLLDIRY